MSPFLPSPLLFFLPLSPSEASLSGPTFPFLVFESSFSHRAREKLDHTKRFLGRKGRQFAESVWLQFLSPLNSPEPAQAKAVSIVDF